MRNGAMPCFPSVSLVAFFFFGTVSFSDGSQHFDDLMIKARAGDSQAQAEVGSAYCTGKGVTKDYQQAYTWLQKAANQNNLAAMSVLGQFYTYGLGVSVDDARAFQWYLAAAAGGNVEGEMRTGECYFQGKGVNRDYGKAVNWCTKAAIQGNSIAQTQLGLAYLKGLGVEKNPQQAFNYLLHAAYHDYGPAQYYVALLYGNGTFVSKDLVQSYKWSVLAERGYNNKDNLTWLSALVTALTGSQIEKGDALVNNWSKEQDGDVQGDPKPGVFKSGTSTNIPFEWVCGNIVITASLQGHENLKFILDTADCTSVLDPKTAIALGIPISSTYYPMVGLGAELMLGVRTTSIRLGVAGLIFDKSAFVMPPVFSEDEHMGMHIDGAIGYDILKNYVIKLDYVNKTVEFASSQSFHLNNDVVAVPLTLSHAKLYVQAHIGSGTESSLDNLIFDTGFDGSILLAKTVAVSHLSFKTSKSIQSETDSLGGIMNVDTVRCSQVKIWNILFRNPIIDIASQNQSIFAQGAAGIVGNEIWRRFDVIIDIPEQRLFLRKNAHFDDHFDYSHSGLSVKAVGPDLRTYVVFEVASGSASTKAGFKIGDVLTKFDNTSLQGLKMNDVRTLFRGFGRHQILVTRDGKPLTLDLELSDSIKVVPLNTPN
jgi:hypothetical protein